MCVLCKFLLLYEREGKENHAMKAICCRGERSEKTSLACNILKLLWLINVGNSKGSSSFSVKRLLRFINNTF